MNFFSVFWVFIEKMGGTIISIISFLIYASILSPSDIGIATIALAMAMGIGQVVANVFQDPLVCVQKLGVRTLSSIFWGGGIISFILASVLATAVFAFSTDKLLILLTFVAVFIIPILFLNSIYSALLRRSGKFKVLAQRVLIGKVVGALAGILTVFYGMGALSMVLQAVTIELFALIALYFSYNMRIARHLCFHEFSVISNVGLPIALRKLSWEGYIKGLPLVIAIFFNANTVGIFAFAWRIVDMPRTALVSGAVSFALPLFSKCNNIKELSLDYQRLNKITMMLFAPLFVGLAVVAEPMIVIFFDNKWIDAVPVVQGLAIYSLISFSRMYVPSVLTALNVPKLTLMTDVISTCVALGVCFIFLPFYGLHAVLLSLFVRLAINYPSSVSELHNRLGISFFEQVIIHKNTLVSIALMVLGVFLYQRNFETASVVHLMIVSFLGALLYVAPTFLLNKGNILKFARRRI